MRRVRPPYPLVLALVMVLAVGCKRKAQVAPSGEAPAGTVAMVDTAEGIWTGDSSTFVPVTTWPPGSPACAPVNEETQGGDFNSNGGTLPLANGSRLILLPDGNRPPTRYQIIRRRADHVLIELHKTGNASESAQLVIDFGECGATGPYAVYRRQKIEGTNEWEWVKRPPGPATGPNEASGSLDSLSGYSIGTP